MFEKGQSGNPSGRPKGSADRRRVFREMIEPHREDLVSKAVEMAKDGNEAMIKLLLDRLLPAKPKDETLQLPSKLRGTLAEKAGQINELIADGEITPTEGNQLLAGLAIQCRVIETSEIVERIDRLEKNIKQGNAS